MLGKTFKSNAEVRRHQLEEEQARSAAAVPPPASVSTRDLRHEEWGPQPLTRGQSLFVVGAIIVLILAAVL